MHLVPVCLQMGKYLGIILGQMDKEKGKMEDVLIHYENEKKIST